MSKITFIRPHGAILRCRLREPRRFIQVITGPRQMGKTTMVSQVLKKLTLPFIFASADHHG